MRVIDVEVVVGCIERMCQSANYVLPKAMEDALVKGKDSEESPIGRYVLDIISKNLIVAKENSIPICQDTGTAVVFVKLGQEVYIKGGGLSEAIHEGVRRGYQKGCLRKSIVKDPLNRVNTQDNTPAIIHYEVVEGDGLEIVLAPKGGGSENMSSVYMLTPSAGVDGIEKALIETIEKAGPNACLPVVIGIGLGGNFERCTLLAKKALLREVGSKHEDEKIGELEQRFLKKVNALGIGPQGLGGTHTALAVHIEVAPCHIASMPLAINLGCHVNRHIECRI